MLDKLEKAIDTGQPLGASYVEIRGESGFIEFIQMDDGRINALTQRLEQGIAVRVLVDGAWGFVSSGNPDTAEDAVKSACSMAKSAASSRKEPIKLADTKTFQETITSTAKRDPRDVDIEEKVQYMKNLTKHISDYDERISAITVKVRTSSGKKFLVTSEGTQIEQHGSLVWVYPWVTGKENARLSAARYEEASTNEGWEFFDRFATPEYIGDKVAEKVKLQLEGVPAKGGSFPCVCGPRVIGVLAHEALGHLAEADLTIQSAFGGKRGEVVAAEGVNMIDDGTLKGILGTSKYDDEGVPTSRVEIIKDSVLTELMTNREYASKIDQRTTGNARAESYLYPPIIRMRNTFFEPGEFNREELFEGIEFGYYCSDFRGGQAQMNASFQVGIQEAYEIVNGELGRPVTDLSISGIATDSLFKIEGIAKGPFPWEQGRCGKGQEAFIAAGGPDVRFAKGGITFGGKD
ncbi:MAG: hypothetical protein BAJATHORv1_40030 [Candidatus Thorarchaeota archaeon]|nr:MAG: hypothetical protein BAJATHORv1_40030 [Candidatus Thorarchaeota archaeon]